MDFTRFDESAELAIVQLDADRRVGWMTRGAQRLVGTDPRLSIVADRLMLVDPRASERLAACLTARGEGWSAVVLPPHRRRPGLVMWVSRADGVVTFRRLAAARPIPAPVLRAAFALTPAEARLASWVSAGHSLHEYTRDAAVSIHTARSQLRQIFGKTSTCRQPELVALLRSAAPPADAS